MRHHLGIRHDSGEALIETSRKDNFEFGFSQEPLCLCHVGEYILC